jgi:hypothetical protein
MEDFIVQLKSPVKDQRIAQRIAREQFDLVWERLVQLCPAVGTNPQACGSITIKLHWNEARGEFSSADFIAENKDLQTLLEYLYVRLDGAAESRRLDLASFLPIVFYPPALRASRERRERVINASPGAAVDGR